MPAYELAQLNIAQMRTPYEAPEMADFMANLERINALADAAPGFVWRLQDSSGNATAMRPFDALTLVNISVWQSVEALGNFVYRSGHVDIMKRRGEWFLRMAQAWSVLWWVPQGHKPTEHEAKERLLLLQSQGPSAAAFTFKQPFPAPV